MVAMRPKFRREKPRLRKSLASSGLKMGVTCPPSLLSIKDTAEEGRCGCRVGFGSFVRSFLRFLVPEHHIDRLTGQRLVDVEVFDQDGVREMRFSVHLLNRSRQNLLIESASPCRTME